MNWGDTYSRNDPFCAPLPKMLAEGFNLVVVITIKLSLLWMASPLLPTASINAVRASRTRAVGICEAR